jgi:hypothetical protein
MEHNIFVCGKGFNLPEVENFIKIRPKLDTTPVILNEQPLESGRYKFNFRKSENLRLVTDFNFSLYNMILLKKTLSMKSKDLTFGSIYLFTESKVQLENFYYIFKELSKSVNFITYIESDRYIKSKLQNFISREYDGRQKKIIPSFIGNFLINRIESL